MKSWQDRSPHGQIACRVVRDTQPVRPPPPHSATAVGLACQRVFKGFSPRKKLFRKKEQKTHRRSEEYMTGLSSSPAHSPFSTAFKMQKRLTTEEKDLANASTKRLAGYLTAGICGGVLGTSSSEAAIVAFDVSGLSGANAGVAVGSYTYVQNVSGNGFGLLVTNKYVPSTSGGTALTVARDGSFLTTSSAANAYPLAAGVAISSSDAASASWVNSPAVFFYHYNTTSGVSDTANSFGLSSPAYLGLRFNTLSSNPNNDYYYGYLEVSWNAATLEFQVVSGAYNDVLNESILAGAAVTAVPEPSGGALAMGAVAALVMGGSAARRWKKEHRQQAAADTPQASA